MYTGGMMTLASVWKTNRSEGVGMKLSEPEVASSVYDRLREMGFFGGVPPGTRLLEQELAETLGVSRIPVRESLGKMVAQGLLKGGASRQGMRIRDYTPEEVRQLLEYRRMIEGAAARSAAKRATAGDIARMRTICDRAESLIGRYGSRRWAASDHRFHAALAEAS